MAAPNIPFMGAVKLGSKKLVAQHLATGKAPLNFKDELGNSALHYAVNLDSYEITQLLLEHHALVNIRNNQDVTPLHIAVRHRNTKIVNLLLKHGADANSIDAEGNSPLHLTANYAHIKCGLEIIELLRTYGAHVTICNNAAKTAHACIIHHQSNLQSSCVIHQKNLITAQQIVHPEQMYPAKSEFTHVHRKYIKCAKSTNLHKMRTMLKHPHININVQHGPSRRSALMHALRHHRCTMAQLLIDAGIDTNLRDCNGLTAYDYARIYNHPTIATQLQQSA
jgi:ankyrin repeat protein